MREQFELEARIPGCMTSIRSELRTEISPDISRSSIGNGADSWKGRVEVL